MSTGSIEGNWDLWGPLAERYRQTRPHRLLALDGGGIRGLLTLQILQRIEDLLRPASKAGSDFRLSDFFDVIAGTSTGAIIAAALARGMSVGEVLSFYRDFGREVFTKRSLFARWKSLYGTARSRRSSRTSSASRRHWRPRTSSACSSS